MPYTLNWSDNGLKSPITINEGTIDTALTPLTLVGKGRHNWGEPMQENLLHLMERFASLGVEPNSPTPGMLWFNATTGQLLLRTTSNTWVQVYPHPVEFW
jgi:hypothetical protein